MVNFIFALSEVTVAITVIFVILSFVNAANKDRLIRELNKQHKDLEPVNDTLLHKTTKVLLAIILILCIIIVSLVGMEILL